MGTNPNKKMAATRTNAGLRPDQSAKVRPRMPRLRQMEDDAGFGKRASSCGVLILGHAPRGEPHMPAHKTTGSPCIPLASLLTPDNAEPSATETDLPLGD